MKGDIQLKNPITGRFAFEYRRFAVTVTKKAAYFFRQSAPVFLALALVFVWSAVVYKKSAPKASAAAVKMARGEIVRAITESATEAIASLESTDFNRISYGEDRTIVAVSADTVSVNIAVRKVLDAVNESVKRLGNIYVSLPIGTLVGGDYMSGRGFRLRFRTEPYVCFTTDVNSELCEAGINQISHKIVLTVIADVTLVCMGYNANFIESVKIPLSESVIIGKIPGGIIVEK